MTTWPTAPTPKLGVKRRSPRDLGVNELTQSRPFQPITPRLLASLGSWRVVALEERLFAGREWSRVRWPYHSRRCKLRYCTETEYLPGWTSWNTSCRLELGLGKNVTTCLRYCGIFSPMVVLIDDSESFSGRKGFAVQRGCAVQNRLGLNVRWAGPWQNAADGGEGRRKKFEQRFEHHSLTDREPSWPDPAQRHTVLILLDNRHAKMACQ